MVHQENCSYQVRLEKPDFEALALWERPSSSRAAGCLLLDFQGIFAIPGSAPGLHRIQYLNSNEAFWGVMGQKHCFFGL